MDISLIDTHCHLTDLTQGEVSAVITRAKESGVDRMICIGASKGTESSFRAVELASQFDEIYCSVGIHPHDADEHDWFDELDSLASHKKVLAIGETGLDYFKEWSDFTKQRELFVKTIRVAKDKQKPLVIHCRDAFDDCLEILESERASEVGGVFHCFSGTAEQALRLSTLNFLVSYTGIITFKKSTEVKKHAALIPLSNIMLETDAPYMAPEPYRGKTSEPAHVALIAKSLAELKQVSFEEICSQTTKNALKLFKGLS